MLKQGFTSRAALKTSVKTSQPGALALGGAGKGPGGGKVRYLLK